MKTLVFVTALCGASLFVASLAQAAPTSPTKQVVPAWDIVQHLAATAKAKRKPLPQSIKKLRLKGGGGPSRVQGDCVYDAGKDISRCEDCEVDWDALVMVCKANMICWDDDKQIPCPSP
jgi:hypothetical protein